MLTSQMQMTPSYDLNDIGLEVHAVCGQELVCRCPFPDHADHHPSFYVNPEKRVYHCWGCGRGGSIRRLYEEFGLEAPQMSPDESMVPRRANPVHDIARSGYIAIGITLASSVFRLLPFREAAWAGLCSEALAVVADIELAYCSMLDTPEAWTVLEAVRYFSGKRRELETLRRRAANGN